MNSKYISAFLFVLLALALVSALSSEEKSQSFNAAITNIKCKTDFTVGVINSMTATSSGTNLSNYVTKLQQDLTQLQSYASSKDVDSFKKYIESNYEPNIKAAREAVQSARKSVKNLSKDDKEKLKSDYKQLRKDFDACHSDSLKGFAEARLNNYNKILEDYQQKADKLAAKGINTSGLNQIIQDARDQIINPLQSTLNNSNEQGLKNVVNKYCLFDGCKTGTNFHLAAKYEIEKLSQIISKMKGETTDNETLTKLNQSQSYLDMAKTALTTIGSSQYTEEAKQQVWDNIKEASKTLKGIYKDQKKEIKIENKDMNKTNGDKKNE